MCSEDGKCLSWPQTIVLVPASNIRLAELHVSTKSLNIHFPLNRASSILKILPKNASPLFTFDIRIDKFSSSAKVSLRDIEASDCFNVALKFLVGLVVSMVERSTLKVDNSGTSVHVVDGGSKSDLCSEPVSSHCCHGELVLVHEPRDVIGDVL